MSVTDPARRREVEADSPDFPIAFREPADAALTWEWDDMHAPFALAPLAAEYVRTMGDGMNECYTRFDFPQRWRVTVWNGYAYFAWHCPGTSEEIEIVRRALGAGLPRARSGSWPTGGGTRRSRSFARCTPRSKPTTSTGCRARHWRRPGRTPGRQRSGAGRSTSSRSWAPYQVMEDLADLYERLVPGAAASEAVPAGPGPRRRPVRGRPRSRDAGRGRRRRRRRLPRGLASAIGPSRVRTCWSSMADRPSSPAWTRSSRSTATWGRRAMTSSGVVGRGAGPPARPTWRSGWSARPGAGRGRRARLRARGGRAGRQRSRARLADRPDELAEFERLLAHARDIGPLTEGHNYWIDRMSQSRLRVLSMRVGGRLAADGAIERTRRRLLPRTRRDRSRPRRAARPPSDHRGARKADHARQLAIVAAARRRQSRARHRRRLTGSTARASSSADPNQLRGTGASAGVDPRDRRGSSSARTTFGRIQPGDIIVCPSSNPSWVPVFAIAGGLVTNTGGVLSHAAVVAREFGLPAVVGRG